MNKWKVAFWICLVVLVASTLHSVYLMFTVRAIRGDWQWLANQQEQVIDGLTSVISNGLSKYGKADIAELLRQASPNIDVVDRDNSLFYGEVVFRFEQDSLVAVYRTF